MKKTIQVEIEQPLLGYMTNIPYKQYHAWSYRSLCLSVLYHRDLTQRHPALVWICGGGFENMDRDIWIPEMQYFARNGYVVVSIDYRTHNIAPYPALLEDAKAAIRYIRAHAEQFGIDPYNIAIMGESAGGYLASITGVTGKERKYDVGDNLDQSSEVQAVINIYGRTQQVRGWQEKVDQKRVRNSTELLLNGKPDAIPEIYEEANPSNHLNADTPPFLLLHGTEDELVPFVQNDIFYDDLEKAGVEVDYYKIEGGSHGSAHFYQPQVKKIILDFLDKHLKK